MLSASPLVEVLCFVLSLSMWPGAVPAVVNARQPVQGMRILQMHRTAAQMGGLVTSSQEREE